MESTDDTPSLRVTALSMLWFPVVIGWTFLLLKITVWVLHFLERRQGEEVPSVTAMVIAGREHDSGGVPVTLTEVRLCRGPGSSTTALDDDGGSDGVGEIELWDNATKNSIWEEFYGAMGEEELDNLSDYSPR